MSITPSLFEAYLKCPTKCWLRFTNEPPSGNAYAEWFQTESESYCTATAKRLTANSPADECELRSSRREEAHYSAETLKTAKWRLALDVPVRLPETASPDPGSSRGNEAQTKKSEIANQKAEISQSLLPSAATSELTFIPLGAFHPQAGLARSISPAGIHLS